MPRWPSSSGAGPAAGSPPAGPSRVPEVWDEFAPVELAAVLGESRAAAGDLMEVACLLETRLPGTRAAFRDGVLTAAKAGIIARACALLDPDEARAAEAMVLGRAGVLTPAGLAAAIARAVMQVAPGTARKRREQAAKQARLERWREGSRNAGLAGRELPPAQVLAAGQRVTWWARQLREAWVDGSRDELRAIAFLDIILNRDSRPATHDTGDGDSGPGGDSHPDWPEPPIPGDPGGSVLPAGFAGTINLTITAATLLGLADRPGEIAGIGPVDPGLARDLAAAA